MTLDVEYTLAGAVEWLIFDAEGVKDYCPFKRGRLIGDNYCRACEAIFPRFTAVYYVLEKLPQSYVYIPRFKCPCDYYSPEQVRKAMQAFVRKYRGVGEGEE